jgi:hypothetical protein
MAKYITQPAATEGEHAKGKGKEKMMPRRKRAAKTANASTKRGLTLDTEFVRWLENYKTQKA